MLFSYEVSITATTFFIFI